MNDRPVLTRSISSRTPSAAPSGRLDPKTLLWYVDGLLALLVYSIVLGFTWERMNDTARMAMAGGSLVSFTAVAGVLRQQERFHFLGEVLQVVAVALIPLFGFALLDTVGVWPHEPHFCTFCPNLGYDSFPRDAWPNYQIDLTWARVGLAGATMFGSFLMFRLSRSPFVLIAAAIVSLTLAAGIDVQGSHLTYTWHTRQALALAAVGASITAAGIALRHRSQPRISA